MRSETDHPAELNCSAPPRHWRWRRWVLIALAIAIAVFTAQRFVWPTLSVRLRVISAQKSLVSFQSTKELAIQTPVEWGFVHEMFFSPGFNTSWTSAFVGFRRDVAGHERIVAVFVMQVPAPNSATGTSLKFYSASLEPGTLFRPLSIVPRSQSELDVPINDWHPYVEFGQADPADAGHLSIDSPDTAVRFTVDCRLNPDGTLAMKYRERPSTQPAISP